MSDPRGHLYGQPTGPLQAVPGSDAWRQEFWYGVDLLNHGFYWEAHEVWEGMWHVVHRTGGWGHLLKGLIKLAAAGVKAREGRAAGIARHAGRAMELLAAAQQAWDASPVEWDWRHLQEMAAAIASAPSLPITPTATTQRVWAWTIVRNDQ